MPSVSKSLRRDSSHPPRLFLNIRMSRIIVGNFNLQGLYIKHSFGRIHHILKIVFCNVLLKRLTYPVQVTLFVPNSDFHALWKEPQFSIFPSFFRSFKFFAFLPGHLQLAASGRCYIWKQQQKHNHHEQPSIFWEMS